MIAEADLADAHSSMGAHGVALSAAMIEEDRMSLAVGSEPFLVVPFLARGPTPPFLLLS